LARINEVRKGPPDSPYSLRLHFLSAVDAAHDLHIRFIHTPGITGSLEMGTTAFLQFGGVPLNPAIDRRMVHIYTSFLHDFFSISITERIAHIPTHAEQNDLSFARDAI
jgi:hypothetical protein